MVMHDAFSYWVAPQLPKEIPHGDMPGDKVCIDEGHICKANTIFPLLYQMIQQQLEVHPMHRAVVTVCGGSGVGKSEIASLLAYYLTECGIKSYTMSGDNYPRRIPKDNDRERMRVYRCGGIRGLMADGLYTQEHMQLVRQMQQEERDADPAVRKPYPWMTSYQMAGEHRLAEYLGSTAEIDFDEVTQIVSEYKRGASELLLKRMGREDTELWYESVDMTDTQVLIIEWTHGNSDHYHGVDIPILLNSTPSETLAHRRARNRDGAVDSPFTMTVLRLEQRMLHAQASKAKIILSKHGEVLDFAEYTQMMAAEEGGAAHE